MFRKEGFDGRGLVPSVDGRGGSRGALRDECRDGVGEEYGEDCEPCLERDRSVSAFNRRVRRSCSNCCVRSRGSNRFGSCGRSWSDIMNGGLEFRWCADEFELSFAQSGLMYWWYTGRQMEERS